ncbi:MAG: hypothetical protein JWP74_551 [Marmoricola sp.]|nr:hypothetical protein [Marmoricola sp.]
MSRRVLAAFAVATLGLAVLTLPGIATAGTPQITAACDQNVAVGHFTCFAERLVTPNARAAAGAAAAPKGYGPRDLASAYGLGSAPSGAGRRVFVVDAYDDAHAAADLATYRRHYGLPACTVANGCFRKLNQVGATKPLPKVDTGWATETSLDLDMVSAACPACSITLIEAKDPSDNLLVAAREAATRGGKYVSMSWGGNDNASDAASDTKYLKKSGVFYSVASGDQGQGLLARSGISYPATSPYVIAVGGTSLTRASSTSRGWSETTWSDTISGCSSHEPVPAWQASVATQCNGRADADVSAVGDPATGVAVYDTYDHGWEVVGGTSAGAPLISGIAARAGAASGTPSAFPYAHASAFNDVTTGTDAGLCLGNVRCQAGPGWDGPTGLGTPRGIRGFGTGTPAATSCTGSLVSNAGFESGAAGWSVAAARVHQSAALAHTGARYVLLDGTGRARTDRLARTVTIPKGCSATLSYYVRVASADHGRTAHDKLAVRVNGTTRQSRSNLSRGAHYQRVTLSLSRYAGTRITVAWVGSENASLATGFYLDDLQVTLSR